jgi:hypothetical protein
VERETLDRTLLSGPFGIDILRVKLLKEIPSDGSTMTRKDATKNRVATIATTTNRMRAHSLDALAAGR